MQIVKNIIKSAFPLAVVITLLCGLLYVTVQQVLRIGANDPQIQMAEDAADALAAGQTPESVVPATKVNIAASLAPYVVVFDDSGNVLASSGLLNNQPPALPSGVLNYVRRYGQDRITWQPEPDVRSATVITRYGGTHTGFVMAGRSLREVENRIDNLGLIVGLGWLGTLFAALVAVSVSEFLLANNSPALKLARSLKSQPSLLAGKTAED